ncbi:MAG: hypothetical protein M0Q12_00865 [Synergistaceae bacterium]|jgi:hypothetical protein|nr:hypothetical protein [Synergistaceae bacterium]
MKAISGYSEWMWAILMNIKPVENRVWSLFRYVQQKDLPIRIYVHGSKTPASSRDITFIEAHLNKVQLASFQSYDFEQARGAVMGEATVYRQVTMMDNPWFFGPYGQLYRDGVLYNRPTPYRGRPGLFEIRLGEVCNGKESKRLY